MDLNYSSEDRAFRDSTRRWLEANVPSRDLKTLDERKAWHRKLYEAGFVGMGWPKEYGGQGAPPMEQAIVAEEMARVTRRRRDQRPRHRLHRARPSSRTAPRSRSSATSGRS